jgi:hypothetical protein
MRCIEGEVSTADELRKMASSFALFEEPTRQLLLDAATTVEALQERLAMETRRVINLTASLAMETRRVINLTASLSSAELRIVELARAFDAEREKWEAERALLLLSREPAPPLASEFIPRDPKSLPVPPVKIVYKGTTPNCATCGGNHLSAFCTEPPP